ncbi:SDR family NAD(P)-dependent oxidoreductase [Cupriavidus sp. 2KB_3]|uniref:SDR family NAD(P)-dependent oxidoreductase n=1 Tax=Cupriavidus TaxID=106589 RepID=UPI0011ECE350|nr:SDR family NAD(P)-dependent oxidoreductase [Cupriavidus campinensis]
MDPIETPIDRLDDAERAPATLTGKRRLAVVTGASTGIGYHLAQCCADHGMDLIIAADEPQIEAAAQTLRTEGTTIEAIQADLSTPAGVDHLLAATRGRQVDVLCANAGRGLGRAFLDSFSYALRHELRDTRVTVTCLMPGATETEFFDRADMLDTRIAQEKKDDPAEVARIGFEAMMRGDGDVITGWQNKLRAAIAMVTPSDVLAEQHRKMAEPMSGDAAVPSVENEPRSGREIGMRD